MRPIVAYEQLLNVVCAHAVRKMQLTAAAEARHDVAIHIENYDAHNLQCLNTISIELAATRHALYTRRR